MGQPALQACWDREALDAGYNLRARVPTFEDWFARYRGRSAATQAAHPHHAGLAYGASPRQIIDLFPARSPGAPLHAFIHGGYWQALDPGHFTFMADPILAAGGAAAIIGYDLAPEVTIEAITAQVRTAIAWLFRNAASYGANPTQITVSGHSAGSHLAAMALAPGWQAAAGVPDDVVEGACLVSGVFDLEPIRRCYLNDVLGMDAAAARRNSPVHMPPGRPLPVVLTLGDDETQAFHEQTEAYRKTLAQAGIEAAVIGQPGHDHFSVIDAIATDDNPAMRAILGQMGLAAAST